MGKFNGKISAEFTPPKTWVLNRELSFQTNEFTKEENDILKEVGANVTVGALVEDDCQITCDKGMKTDLASVPRIAWAVIAPWDCARAAVIHDHLYAVLRKYYHSEDKVKSTWRKARKLSDDVFLLGMKSADPKISKFKMYSAYWSVRLFGRWPASAKEQVKYLSGGK